MKGSTRLQGGEVGGWMVVVGGGEGIGGVFVWQMINGYNRERGKIGQMLEEGEEGRVRVRDLK